MGFWFAETNLEKVFFAFAVTGGTFFAFRAVSLFLGFGGEDAAAARVDGGGPRRLRRERRVSAGRGK